MFLGLLQGSFGDLVGFSQSLCRDFVGFSWVLGGGFPGLLARFFFWGGGLWSFLKYFVGFFGDFAGLSFAYVEFT